MRRRSFGSSSGNSESFSPSNLKSFDSVFEFASFQPKRSFSFSECEWKMEEDMGNARSSIEDFTEAAKAEGLDLDDLSSVLLLYEASRRLGHARRHGWNWALGL